MIDVLDRGDSGPSLKVKEAVIATTRMIHPLDHGDSKTDKV